MKRRTRRLAIALAGGVAASATLLAALVAVPFPARELRPDDASSLRVVDRQGRLLRELPLGGGGRDRWVPLERVASSVVLATIASEDHRYYAHHGVDPLGVVRAAVLDLSAGHVVYGGSTLTMQLVRLLEPRPRTLGSKLIEAVRALRLERAATKREILEQYLNRAYYGNGAFGIEEAAERYFGKPASALSTAEGTLLAVLPRAPTAYDPRRHLATALGRRAHVLGLLVERGFLGAEERAAVERQPLAFAPTTHVDEAPHFVDWVLGDLPPERRAAGGELRTTLDLPLQHLVERRVREHVEAERDRGVLEAGVVVIDPATGAVRAMVGSADYSDPDAGQLNIATTARHPGSALKPFVYALALEAGDTPATLVDDATPIDGWQPEHPAHPHGPTRYREALAGSMNLAAVHVLDCVGVPRLLERLRAAGLGPLDGTPADYRLSLALGSARVRMVDLAAAYGFLVEGGVVVPAHGLADEAPAPRRVYSPEVSWLVADMLADNEARRAVFGAELPLDLPFPVAAKTGTSSGFADTVCAGATRQAVVVAWAGDFEGRGTHGLLAMWSAAPLVREALLAVATIDGAPLDLPPPPPGIEAHDVCRFSGLLPGPRCPTKHEHFAPGTAPTARCASDHAHARSTTPPPSAR